MSILQAVILGIVQGFTEFLPVSSSGHLVLSRNMLGAYSGLITFEVFLHLGTAIAVIFAFWEDLRKLFTLKDKEYRHFALMLIIAIIPTAVLGVFFEDFIEAIFASSLVVGAMLFVTGTLLYMTKFLLGRGNKGITNISILDALIIGLAQGLAITPGISRSGITIVGALFRRLDRNVAARFSFILSLPTILGAGLYRTRLLIGGNWDGPSFPVVFWGTVAALIAGYIAIKILLRVIREGNLHYFAFYCWLVGLFVILQHYFL